MRMCIFVGLIDFVKRGILIFVGEIPRYRNYHCYWSALGGGGGGGMRDNLAEIFFQSSSFLFLFFSGGYREQSVLALAETSTFRLKADGWGNCMKKHVDTNQFT